MEPSVAGLMRKWRVVEEVEEAELPALDPESLLLPLSEAGRGGEATAKNPGLLSPTLTCVLGWYGLVLNSGRVGHWMGTC